MSHHGASPRSIATCENLLITIHKLAPVLSPAGSRMGSLPAKTAKYAWPSLLLRASCVAQCNTRPGAQSVCTWSQVEQAYMPNRVTQDLIFPLRYSTHYIVAHLTQLAS